MDDTLKYAVEIDDQTASTIDRINQRLADVHARASSSSDAVMKAYSAYSQRAMAGNEQKARAASEAVAAAFSRASRNGIEASQARDSAESARRIEQAAAASSARLKQAAAELVSKPASAQSAYNVESVKKAFTMPSGFGDKMASEVEGGLKRIDRGLFKTFGGIGNIMAGNFRAGITQISQGIADITGKSAGALGQMAMKAGAVGAAFGAGWKLGKILDEALGISDRIAKAFDMGDSLKWLDQYRDSLREIRATKLDDLKKEFEGLAQAARDANDAADLLARRKTIQAEREGKQGAEYGIEVERIESRRRTAQDQIDTAQARRKELDDRVRTTESAYASMKARGATAGELATARSAVLDARQQRREQAPVLEAAISENRKVVERLAVDREEVEAKADRTIKANREKAETAETERKEKDREKVDSIFKKRDREVVERRAQIQQDAIKKEVEGMEVADKKDREIIKRSEERQAKLAEVVEDRKEKTQMTAHERRELRKDEREKEREEKRDKKRQDRLERSALQAQRRIEAAEDGRGLGGRLTRRQREALEGIAARQESEREKAREAKAKADIQARELRRAVLDEAAAVARQNMILELQKINGKLGLA